MRTRLLMIGLLVAASSGMSRAVMRNAAQAPDGKALYEENCKKCHGVIGNPPKTMKAKYPKIATFNEKFAAEHSVDSIVTVLTKGKNEDMKSFKDKLNHDEMTAVAKYVETLAAAKPGT